MNKQFARLRTKARNAAIIVACSAPVLALATPSDPFTTAMATATERVEDYAAALVGLAAVGVVFMIAIKYVKKIRGAA
jgi:hypothetical protein